MSELAATFLTSTFNREDWIAIVLIHRATNHVLQRIDRVQVMISSPWQAWLAEMNARGHDVYYSINTLRPGTHRRTKVDIHAIRHLFLDIDDQFPRRLQRLQDAGALPPAHHVVLTSPGRGQLLWRVIGLSLARVERLQQQLAVTYEADRAATDAARVARLPGYWNCKYPVRTLVTVQSQSTPPYSASAFPAPVCTAAALTIPTRPCEHWRDGRRSSQSERDWSWVLRRLAAGEPVEVLERQLARQRRDKRRPADYAARTVDAAWAERQLAASEPLARVVEILLRRRATRPHGVAYVHQIVMRAAMRLRTRRTAVTATHDQRMETAHVTRHPDTRDRHFRGSRGAATSVPPPPHRRPPADL